MTNDKVDTTVLIDVPDVLHTERLILRPPRPGDGTIVNAAVIETIEGLRAWMPWAKETPSVERTEEYCRRAAAAYVTRKELGMFLWHKDGGAFVGGAGFHAIDWTVPRLEIGYWIGKRYEGQGYCSEAVAAITRMAFETLKASRIEIRCDDRNARSGRVAERCGYTLEGVLRRNARDNTGELCDTRVYARTSPP